MRILLCDDEPLILSWLQAALEPYYTVIGMAQDGPTLVAMAQAFRPDFILTELDMPIQDGLDTIRQLHRVLPGCRIICHTSWGEPEVIAAALSAGAAGYLIKGGTGSASAAVLTTLEQARLCRGESIVRWGTTPMSATPFMEAEGRHREDGRQRFF